MPSNYLWVYVVVLSVVGVIVLSLFIMGLVLCLRRRSMGYNSQRRPGVANMEAIAGPNFRDLIRDESVLRKINIDGPEDAMRCKIERYKIRIEEYSENVNIFKEKTCPVCLVNF